MAENTRVCSLLFLTICFSMAANSILFSFFYVYK